MSDTKNVKLGVCKVFYGGVDLGYTQGGVQVAVKTETHKVNVDQFGKTTVDEVIMSRDVTAKVPLAETTLENLVAIMPGAVLNQSGGAAATGSLTVASVPADGDTVTVNGTVFTFKTAAPVGNQVLIGASVSATATNLKNVLAASVVANVAVATYSVSGAIVTATYGLQGVVGNSFTLASAQASVTVIAASGGVNPSVRNVEVTTGVGVSLLHIAKELRLHPVALPDSDKSEDFVIPLAATPGGMDFAYEVEKERIFNCEFTGYPDSANGGKLFKVGA